MPNHNNISPVVSDNNVPITSFVIGGTVAPDNPTYISRPASQKLFEVCLKGQFGFVFASRQIGKSSLVIGVIQQLKKQRISTVFIDLSAIGKVKVLDEWYYNVIDEFIHQLQFDVSLASWWEQNSRISPNKRFNLFLETQILPHIDKNLIVFMDEIDTMLGFDFTGEAMANIRALYNAQKTTTIFQKLTFVLVGMATPDELINDPLTTPFNIGERIDLVDFTKSELNNFRYTLLAKYLQDGEQYFEDIFAWTNGHPYLTQKLCSLVVNTPISERQDLVRKLVQQHFIDQLTEFNITFVQNSLTKHELAEEMLEVYQEVVKGNHVPDDVKSHVINRLKLTGLVVATKGVLEIRNKLYATIFDKTWVEKALDNLKNIGLPYYYDIIQTLNKNGPIMVYRATDTRNGQELVVKVLHLKVSEYKRHQQLIEQFKTEIETIRQFKHPNIIDIYEVDERKTSHLNEQKLYLAMRYMSGGTLAQRLKTHPPLLTHEALRLLKEIGSALAVIHGQGYLHRDLKPQNILLEQQPDGLHAVVADFGIATLNNRPNNGEGTLSYAAPEQHEIGSILTPAVDIYALGLMAYELLAGKYSSTSLPHFDDIDKEIFYNILDKSTRDDPLERYETVIEFVEALVGEFVEVEIKRANSVRKYPGTALQILEVVLFIDPDNHEAISLKSEMLEKEGDREEALKTLEKAIDRKSKDILPLYLRVLDGLAGDLWESKKYDEAIKRYSKISQVSATISTDKSTTLLDIQQTAMQRQVEYYRQGYGETLAHNDFEGKQKSLDERIRKLTELEAEEAIKALMEQKRLLVVDYYYELGLKVYAEGQPDNLDEAIEQLEPHLRQVEAYQGETEATDLQTKLTDLQNRRDYQQGEMVFKDNPPKIAIERVKLYLEALDARQATQAQALRQQLIDVAQEAISQYKPDESDEDLFHFYREIDQTYLKLNDLDSLYQNLEANVGRRWHLSKLAGQQGDYQTALGHLTKVRAYTVYEKYGDKTKYPLVRLDKGIEALRQKQTHSKEYQEIQVLIAQKEYQTAFQRLRDKFLNQGTYKIDQNPNLFDLARALFETKPNEKLELIGDLQEQLQKARQENKQFEINLTAKEKENQQLTQHLKLKEGQMREAFGIHETEAEHFRINLATKKKKIQDLETELATKEKQIQQVQTDLATKEKLAQQLRTELTKADNQIKNLSDKLTASQMSLQAVNTALATKDKDKHKLESDFASEQQLTKQLQDKIRDKEVEIQNISKIMLYVAIFTAFIASMALIIGFITG